MRAGRDDLNWLSAGQVQRMLQKQKGREERQKEIEAVWRERERTCREIVREAVAMVLAAVVIFDV